MVAPRRSAPESLARFQSAPWMVDPVITASVRSTSNRAASENLHLSSSHFGSERPERSAKLKLHRSNFAFVSTTFLEIARLNVDPWNLAPRKPHSEALRL